MWQRNACKVAGHFDADHTRMACAATRMTGRNMHPVLCCRVCSTRSTLELSHSQCTVLHVPCLKLSFHVKSTVHS